MVSHMGNKKKKLNSKKQRVRVVAKELKMKEIGRGWEEGTNFQL